LRADLCRGAQAADASFRWARGVLDEVIAKLTTFPEAVDSGKIQVSGNPTRLGELMMLMDEFPPDVRDRRAKADGGKLTQVIPGHARARTSDVQLHPEVWS
jgi:hypothetical protein